LERIACFELGLADDHGGIRNAVIGASI
jgi:hypothetical protein